MRSRFSTPHARLFIRAALTLATGLALVTGPLVSAPAQAATSSVSGTVTGTSGQSLPGIYVIAYDAAGEYAGDVQTDAQGRYSLGPLPDGRYKLAYADLENTYATQFWQGKVAIEEADPLDVGPSGRSGVDVTLSLNSTIEGTVTTRESGVPLGGITVSSAVSDGQGGWYVVSRTTTGGDGTYALYVPNHRSYRISFEDPSYATQIYLDHTGDGEPDPVVVDGPIVRGIDARLYPRPAIGGQVTSPGGSAISSVHVTAFQLRSGTWEPVADSTTGSDGSYLVVVDSGTYRLGFSKPGYDAIGQEDGQTFTVGSTAVSGRNATLYLTPTVSVSGAPKVGQTVSATTSNFRDGETLTYRWSRSGEVITAATDRTYRVTADDQGKRLRVTVTGTRSGTSRSIDSPDTGVVDPGTLTTSEPVLSGVAEVGRTLSVDPGVWGPSVEPGLQWYRGSTPITGEFARTYVVSSADIGQQVWVRATGTKAGYTPASRDSQRSAVVPTPPQQLVATSAPTISGTARVGQTLTAILGTWNASDVTSTYQWRRAGQDITGATSRTYTATSADAGATLTVQVTGRKSGMLDGTAVSAETAQVVLPSIAISARPVIGGTPQVGRALTVDLGTVSPLDATPHYQWLKDGVVIPGATSLSYTPSASDVGSALTFTHSATKKDWADASTTSTATARVVAADSVPTTPTPSPTPTTEPIESVDRPTLTGTPTVGQVLTASPGTWSPLDVTPQYAWLRDGTPIAGATDSSYRLVSADAGREISVRVTVSKPDWVDTSAVSDPVLVASPPAVSNAIKPRITGTPRVGSTLSVNPGTWTPTSVALTYQWRRNGAAIKGATKRTYGLTTADQGKRISVRVTAARFGYSPTTVESTRTAAIARKLTPSISVSTTVSSRRPTFTVRLSATGATPTGRVVVKLKSRQLAVATVRSKRAVLRLPTQKKGRFTYTIVYSGDAKVASRSVTRTIVIR